MADFLAGLIAIIVEAILKVFTSKVFVKLILSTFVYVFLFAIIPTLIKFLVPDSVLHAVSSYFSMLSAGSQTLTCNGSEPVATQGPSQTVQCSGITITLAQWGPGIAYILQWIQFPAFLAVFLPVMAVTFLFKRI